MEENYTSNEVVGFIGKLKWKPIFSRQGAMTVVDLDAYVVRKHDKFVKVTKDEDREGFVKNTSSWLSKGEYEPIKEFDRISIGVFHFGRYIKDEQMPEKRFSTRNSEMFIPYKTETVQREDGKRQIGKGELYIHEDLYNELLSEFKKNVSEINDNKTLIDRIESAKKEILTISESNYYRIEHEDFNRLDSKLQNEIYRKAFQYPSQTEDGINQISDMQRIRYFLCGIARMSAPSEDKKADDWIRISKTSVFKKTKDKVPGSEQYLRIGNRLLEINIDSKSLIRRDYLIELNENENREYYCINPEEELPGKYEDNLVIWFIKVFFNLYKTDNVLFLPYEKQRTVLTELKQFVPKGCDHVWLEEWFFNRIAYDRVLGIKKDPVFGGKEIVVPDEEETESEFQMLRDDVIKHFKELLSKPIPNLDDIDDDIRNDIMNLMISVSLNFVTVISGPAGTARGALCKAIGKDLEYGEDVSDVNRYRHIDVSQKWKNREYFEEQFYDPEGQYHDMIKWLDEEKEYLDEEKEYSDEEKEESINLDSFPYIITFGNINNIPIESFFEDYLNIAKDWYRTDDHQIGDTDFCVPKTLRFMLIMDNDQNGLLPREYLDTLCIINYDNCEDIKNKINEKKISLLPYFESIKPEKFKEDILAIESKIDSEYKEIIDEVSKSIKKNVKVDDISLSIESNRTEHAVIRYWNIAKKYLKHVQKNKEEIKKYVPVGIFVDSELIPETGVELEPEDIAMDYAISQRMIPYITRIRGKVEISNLTELIETLLRYKLFKCAKQIKDTVESGRIKLTEKLSDKFNEEFVIKKCKSIYDTEIKKSEDLDGKKDEEIIGHLQTLINQFRDKDYYTRNVVVNMFICLTQGFLTVFSGAPGCGKTSICRILGGITGLYNFTENEKVSYEGYKEFSDRRNETVNPSRFLEVSTERGWTSKRDFIGYYNPLTERFDKTNALLYNAFLVMDDEAKNRKDTELPWFILLDEANLSPMEYYWADFMNLCEAWNENNSIDLGGGKVFKIPETLHFVATINNDHTTEILSPRLIDRANVIDLPSMPVIKDIKPEDGSAEIVPVPWNVLKEVFGCPEDEAELFRDGEAKDQEIIDCKKTYLTVKADVQDSFSILISPRTDIAVSRYWTTARKLFSDESCWIRNDYKNDIESLKSDDPDVKKLSGIIAFADPGKQEDYERIPVDKAKKAMDYAIAQRVLPKITDVSGENALGLLSELLNKLMDEQLYKSAGIIIDMIQRGYESGFFNYFR